MFNSNFLERIKGYETPLYVYDLNLLKRTLTLFTEQLKRYNFHAHYAFKANANPKILELIKEYGLGADCVSGNEVSLALASGFAPENIVFAGVGKSDKEILTALDGGIFSFNCESIEEVKVINELAGSRDVKGNIALRINPNVDANTHKYITTGTEENKFGISDWMFDEVIELIKRSENLNFVGLHFHIGSQITDLDVFRVLSIRANEIINYFGDKGLKVKSINMGGGLGIDYENPDKNPISDFESYFAIIDKYLHRESWQEVHFEPGRALVGQVGSLISKVLYVKRGRTINFVILDAGMTDLLRPALYQASHKIVNLSSNKEQERYHVVGPVCESSDIFGEDLLLPLTERGDYIAIRSAGAYGEVMASRYNQRDLAQHIYLE